MEPYVSITPANRFHPWSRFPDELKLNVLSHLLISDEPLEQADSFHAQLLKLIATRNTELSALAHDVYYKCNTFQITFNPVSETRGISMRHPNWMHAASIQRLKIVNINRLVFSKTIAHTYWENRQSKHLLQPKHDLSVSEELKYISLTKQASDTRSTDWQHLFTNLKEINFWVGFNFTWVDYRGYGPPPTIAYFRDLRDRALGQLEEVDIFLKADTVEVNLMSDAVGTHPLEYGYWCEIAEKLKGMMKKPKM
ncbi:hypothetical protein CC80DRAFT_494471 [Byssothecium circinans]|uniref:Uncharacterized protein n=1 Tax=Byssothecium circinans TaxID=147558 RepID=A0A6A5TMZ0_9PLEO|nr:hypothetical protein CC80DRAFT_494471 [Byssothecium circinans]